MLFFTLVAAPTTLLQAMEVKKAAAAEESAGSADSASSSNVNKDIIIAWDLHGVLFDLDITGELISTVGKEIWASPGLPFRLIYQACSKKGNIFKEAGVRRMTNCQKPVAATWAMIDEFKKEGYPEYIFSNINEPTLHELTQKFPKRFDVFDGMLSVPDGKKGWKKPSNTAYRRFKALVAEKHDLTKVAIIFVDNKKDNVTKAREHGLIGILFTDPAQVKNDITKAIAAIRRDQKSTH